MLEDVRKTYTPPIGPPVEAVRGVDLVVGRGEIFGLVGPNGAGKTTTISMITTRHEPTSGTIRVDGVDVVGDPANAKRHVGVAPQMPNLDHSLTVWEILYLHGRYFGLTRRDAVERTRSLLDRFMLAEKSATRPIDLSGGMVRRLLLCRALVHRPTLLLLDEATVGIDPQTRRAMWDEIERLRQEGTTVLLTTHYIEEADALCDRVAIIDHGVLLAVDTPAELKRMIPAGTRIEVVIDTDLRADAGAAVAELADVGEVETTETGLRVWVTGGDKVVPEVVAAIVASGAHLHHVSVHEPSLEDVFIHFTGRELRE
ncbi:MAG: ATP-binding cassette domain-containing protein [Acidimicrobiia bacterium]|nr:ATP-binding cassette domain-containing protein [Acidimicrobiia bacterium]